MRRIAYLAMAIFIMGWICLAAPAPQQAAGPTITIQVTDKATAEPIVQAKVSVNGANNSSSTDDLGQCALSPPDRGYFSIEVSKDNYVTMLAMWEIKPGQKLPEQVNFAMEPGTSIGGTVVDETGKSVSGAMVHLMSNRAQKLDGSIQSMLRADVRTDNSGKWRTDIVPAKVEKVYINVTHPDFFVGNSFNEAPPVAKLRDRSAVIMIQHAAVVSGIVLDPAGKPVSGAVIGAFDQSWNRYRQKARTDSKGQFTLRGMSPVGSTFTVMSTNFAPAIVTTFSPTTQPLQVHLVAGKTMKLHVVDQSGNPLPGVTIGVDQWQGTNFDYLLHTNANGDATWTGAPSDEVELNFSKRGLGQIIDRSLVATTRPITITLGPKTRIHGAVIDAASGEPIKDFTIRTGTVNEVEASVYWENPVNNPGSKPRASHNGQFTYTP